MRHEEDPRFKNLETKIGVFVAISLAGIIAVFFFIGLQKGLFAHKYTLRFTADRGTGFTKGMPVKLSGFRIGRTTSIALNEQAMVDITIEIDKKYKTWIRSDSTVKLVKEGLVGDNIVEVSVGSLDKSELDNNDSIVYVKTKALDELADEIADKVKPVLIEVRDIISYVNNPDGDLKKAIRNIEVLTRNLERTRGHADAFLVSSHGNIDRISASAVQTLGTVNKKIDGIDLAPTLNRLNSTIEKLDNRVPALLDKTDSTLDNVVQISKQTRLLAENTFPRIPGLLSQTEDVLLSTDKLLNSINNFWLFKDEASQAATPRVIRGDSLE